MLDATDPLALVILAHYCALVYFPGNYWWKIDWAEDTIKSILFVPSIKLGTNI